MPPSMPSEPHGRTCNPTSAMTRSGKLEQARPTVTALGTNDPDLLKIHHSGDILLALTQRLQLDAPRAGKQEMVTSRIVGPDSAALRTNRLLFVTFVSFAVFALCFQGIFYLFEYRGGDTLAPTYIKLQKDMVWAIVLAIAFYVGVIQARKIDSLLQSYNLILLAFCVWIVAVKVVEFFHYDSRAVMLLTLKNLVLYAAMVPLLGMAAEATKLCLARKILIVFVAVSLAQAAFSAALFDLFPEYAFWKDDPYYGFSPFVGLFSNPNRFSLFLNMGAAVLCMALVTANAWRSLLAAAGLLALALSIFYSASLSQLIVYFGLLAYATMIAPFKTGWRCLRLPAVMVAAVIAIGWVGLNFKSPLPDETHKEAALAWDLKNLASLALHGRTIDGGPLQFKSDSFINRLREIEDLMESFGFKPEHHASTAARKPADKAPLVQRIFGRPDHLAPASQSQFAYIYFRYGLIGLSLFAGVLFIPAARGALALARGKADEYKVLLSYHLCLVAFLATFLGDNGLLDFPTNFLLFFVLFANQSLVGMSNELRPAAKHPAAAYMAVPPTRG